MDSVLVIEASLPQVVLYLHLLGFGNETEDVLKIADKASAHVYLDLQTRPRD